RQRARRACSRTSASELRSAFTTLPPTAPPRPGRLAGWGRRPRAKGIVLRPRLLPIAALAAALAATATAASVTASTAGHASVEPVLLLAVDGLHQSDLSWYVANHPSSALAKLARKGTEFTHAQTPVPSDSFPGLVAQATGGNPSSTGIYYDDTWNRA